MLFYNALLYTIPCCTVHGINSVSFQSVLVVEDQEITESPGYTPSVEEASHKQIVSNYTQSTPLSILLAGTHIRQSERVTPERHTGLALNELIKQVRAVQLGVLLQSKG